MISEPIQVCYSNFSPFPNPAVLNIPRRYSDNKIVNKPASPMRKRTRFETAMIFRPILPLPPRSVFARSRSTVYFVIAVGYSVISARVNLFQPCKRFSSIGRLWGVVRASRRRRRRRGEAVGSRVTRETWPCRERVRGGTGGGKIRFTNSWIVVAHDASGRVFVASGPLIVPE